MQYKEHTALRTELGLRNGQLRASYRYNNLWWSFTNAESSFGFGDLDQDDFGRIYQWILNNDSTKVFTAWNEHHGTPWQQTDYPIVRISANEGITFPHKEHAKARYSDSGQ